MFNLGHDNPIINRFFGAFFLAVTLLTVATLFTG